MLASTMQISNNKPGPTHSAAKPDPHRNQDGTDTSRPKRKNNQTPPHKGERPARSLRTQQRTHNHHQPPRPVPPLQPPKEATKSTERRNNQQKIAIVSVPPMSNTAAGHMPTKRRMNPPTKGRTVKSSLERR